MIKGNLSQRDDNLHMLQPTDLTQQKRLTSLELLKSRFVVGRCAPDGRADIAVV
jgi:hypothetical protein